MMVFQDNKCKSVISFTLRCGFNFFFFGEKNAFFGSLQGRRRSKKIDFFLYSTSFQRIKCIFLLLFLHHNPTFELPLRPSLLCIFIINTRRTLRFILLLSPSQKYIKYWWYGIDKDFILLFFSGFIHY